MCKVALVTGASRGIGLETARLLGDSGFHVLMASKSASSVDLAASELAESGLSVEPIVIDISDEDQVRSAVRQVGGSHGVLDVLVNNAGIRVEPYGRSPSQQPIDLWRETFETNVYGTVRMSIEFLGLLKASSAGRIVNVSSLLGSVTTHSDRASYTFSDTFKSLPAYSASKSAINSWTVHLAFELRDTKMKVNAVHPGYSRTDMNGGAGDMGAFDGARTSFTLATLGPEGPTGSFRHFGEVIPW